MRLSLFLQKGWLFSRSSILSILMSVLMATVTATLIFTGTALVLNERSIFQNMSLRTVTTLAGVIGSNSTAALAFMDQKVGTEILNGLASETEIVTGCLFVKTGEQFASYQSPNSSQSCPQRVPDEGSSLKWGQLILTQKIVHEGEDYGWIYLVSNMSHYKRQMKAYSGILFGVLIMAGLIAYLMALKLQRLVTESITKLTETARFISKEGMYSMRAERAPEEEVNDLVTSFNHMLDVIQEREETIRQSEEQFRAAFELSAVGHVLISPEGNFMRVNTEVCRLFGYGQDELLQMSFVDVTEAEDLEKSKTALRRLVEEDDKNFTFEKRFVTKGGDVLWAIVSAATILDVTGRVTAIISVIQDITERKRAEQERDHLLRKEREARMEAEKSVQVRDEFLSIASHELRTPIAPIKMHMEMMRFQVQKMSPDLFPEGPELMQAFDISDRQIENLERLIQDLLDVSRITAGRIILNRRNTDLVAIVTDALERSQHEIQRSNSEIRLKIEARPVGFWDPMRLEQIFMNLLSNALKYGGGTPIQIAISRTPESALLVVQDQGIGIAREDQEKIFERFERAASLRHYSGLGLGLYITRELVAAHGGSIRVRSGLGEGASFSVELPLPKDQ